MCDVRLLQHLLPVLLVEWRQTVSYTHLDVYKRQVHRYGLMRGETVFIATKPEAEPA